MAHAVRTYVAAAAAYFSLGQDAYWQPLTHARTQTANQACQVIAKSRHVAGGVADDDKTRHLHDREQAEISKMDLLLCWEICCEFVLRRKKVNCAVLVFTQIES